MKRFTQIKWTLENAASEFGVDRKTLTRKLRQAGISGDHPSTREICTAIYGDLHASRLATQQMQQEEAALELEMRKGLLVDRAHLTSELERVVANVRQCILQEPSLSKEGKEKLLNAIADIIDPERG